MGIQYLDDRAVLQGHVTVEDAEGLLGWLRESQERRVDLSAAAHVHAAVLQVLLALKPAISAGPACALLAGVLGVPAAAPLHVSPCDDTVCPEPRTTEDDEEVSP